MATYPPRTRQPLRQRKGDGNGLGHANANGNGNGNGNNYFYELGAGGTIKEQIFEVLHVLFKRKRLIAGLFLAVVLPGLFATLMRRPTYVATAKVLIASDRADITIQPTEINSLTTVKLNESVVNSEVHIIRSRELLKEVVTKLALAKAGGVVGIANAADDQEVIGEQVLRLSRALNVTPVRASNVIEIQYPSSDPARAAMIVNRIVDEYLAYHAYVHGHKGLSTFYEEQSRLLEQNVRRAEEALREFSYREGLVAPAVEIGNAVENLSELEKAFRNTNAGIAGLEEKLRTVREQLAQQPPLVKRAQLLEVNPVVRQLREHLIDRQVDRIALMRKYTGEARFVRDNAEEIAELEAQLGEALRDQPTVVSQQIFRSNPVYDQRLNQLLELEATLKEQRAKRAILEEDLARGRRQLVLLKQKALEFDRLDQEVGRRRSTLDLYEKRQQEARIGDAMDQEKLVNVEVVQRPALPLPRADQRRGPLVLAILSALAVSLGAAFGVEYINRTLRFERDVEKFLALPVLATVSDANRV
jgi:uncharacterized protein involved in exopolysaccharide biosynthesis